MASDPNSSADEVRAIVRAELARSRAEARADAVRILRAVGALYAASLLVYLAAVFLALMAVYILGRLLEPWAGAAIVGGSILVVALAVFRRTWRAAQRALAGPPPDS